MISSSNAASIGAISVSTACIGLSFIVERVDAEQTICARLNGRPESSSAAMVLSNVGADLVGDDGGELGALELHGAAAAPA